MVQGLMVASSTLLVAQGHVTQTLMVASSTLLVAHRSCDPDTNGGVQHTIGGAQVI